jgi:hypothetical protein
VNVRVDTAVYRHSARFFVAFLVCMVLAFWPSYFTRLLSSQLLVSRPALR